VQKPSANRSVSHSTVPRPRISSSLQHFARRTSAVNRPRVAIARYGLGYLIAADKLHEFDNARIPWPCSLATAETASGKIKKKKLSIFAFFFFLTLIGYRWLLSCRLAGACPLRGHKRTRERTACIAMFPYSSISGIIPIRKRLGFLPVVRGELACPGHQFRLPCG